MLFVNLIVTLDLHIIHFRQIDLPQHLYRIEWNIQSEIFYHY